MGWNLDGKWRSIYFYDDRLWGMISFLLIICNNDFKKSILFSNRNFKYFIKAYILHYAVLSLLLTLIARTTGPFSNKYFLPCVTVDLEFFACAKKQVFCSVGCCSNVTQRPLFLMTSSSTQFAVCHPIPTLQSDIIINNLAANDISISLFSIFILVGISCITP